MNKKKGFTLIELLAVIVILSILILVAVPKILNVIESSKRSASISSAYGYVKSVKFYQTSSELNKTDKLINGIYNVSKQTIVNGKKYLKLNDVVSVKGNKPSTGTVSIDNNGNVSSSKLCINDYAIQYIDNKMNIISDSCEGMDLFASYSTNTSDWAEEKELTISFPEGYEYYFELETGKVLYNNTDIKIGSETKVSSNEFKLILKDNSKIKTWILYKNKRIAMTTYEENKIDNVKLNKPIINLTAGYPILTKNGVKVETDLIIDYENVEGSAPYYSIDDGNSWIKYNNPINVSAKKVLAKIVRTKSKRESEISESIPSTISNAIGLNAYDNNTNTSFSWSNTSSYYINVSKEVIGKKVYINFYSTYSDYSTYTTYFDFLDSLGNVISTFLTVKEKGSGHVL